MKTRKIDKRTLKKSLLAITETWTMVCALQEHRRASTVTCRSKRLSDREVLVIRLMQKYPNKITEKTLCKLFGMQYSQVGQMVKRLTGFGVLEKPGRGKGLRLVTNSASVIEDLDRIQANKFMPLCKGLTDEEFHQLINILQKVHKTAQAMFEDRMFAQVAFDFFF